MSNIIIYGPQPSHATIHEQDEFLSCHTTTCHGAYRPEACWGPSNRIHSCGVTALRCLEFSSDFVFVPTILIDSEPMVNRCTIINYDRRLLSVDELSE